ncbi:hypothetical protein D5b_00230 [Faustovirus]|nr:hypothetical protein D5b_00230 [Faustovirus]AMN84684.1 hypothetical protein D6_00281 [Faustovirus]AMP44182.1 hypothetical protein PRJ_Dakar_00226 [Faustovirus]
MFSVKKITESGLQRYEITNGFDKFAPSSDELTQDTTTNFRLRGIQVSAKDANRAWDTLHVAAVVEGNNNVVVFKAQLERPQTIDITGDYYACVPSTSGVNIEKTGKILKIAIVMSISGDICAISAYKLTIDVVKRPLAEIAASNIAK